MGRPSTPRAPLGIIRWAAPAAGRSSRLMAMQRNQFPPPCARAADGNRNAQPHHGNCEPRLNTVSRSAAKSIAKLKAASAHAASHWRYRVAACRVPSGRPQGDLAARLKPPWTPPPPRHVFLSYCLYPVYTVAIHLRPLPFTYLPAAAFAIHIR